MTTLQAISYYHERKITAQTLIEEERSYWQGRAAKGEATPFIIAKVNYMLGTMHTLLEVADRLEKAVAEYRQDYAFLFEIFQSAANGEQLYLQLLTSKSHQPATDADGAPPPAP